MVFLTSSKLKYLHVKIHQDDATEIHLLPWTSQMNVHTSTLATDYPYNYSESSKTVPFIQPSKTSLTINGETITRRFAQRLRQAASSPRISKKLLERNNWSQHTFKSISSDVPGKALILWRTAPKSSSSNLHTTIFQELANTCTGSNELQTTNAQSAAISQKPNGIFLAAPANL